MLSAERDQAADQHGYEHADHQRRLTARATRRSIQTGVCEGVSCRRGAVDEQRAPGDDLLAGPEIADHLDEIAVGEAGLDLTH